MSQDSAFIDNMRQLVEYLREGGRLTQDLVDYLEETQDALASLYHKHDQDSPEGTEVMSELVREALQLVHDGIEEILVVHDEEQEPQALASALGLLEEGNDLLATVRHSIENDTSWTSDAAVG